MDSLSEPTQSPTSPSPGAGVHGEGGDPRNASLPPHSERQGQTERALSLIQAQREAQESDPGWLREQLAKARSERDEALAARSKAIAALVDCAPMVSLLAERDQLRQRVAELEAYAPRMDGPSRVEYLERRVAELEDDGGQGRLKLLHFAKARIRDLETANAALEARIRDLEAKLAEQDAEVLRLETAVRLEESHRKALEKRLKEPWRPIETAPRDGTHVLVWACFTGHNSRFEEAIARYNEDVWETRIGRWVCIPTHWQPLPPAPGDDVAEMRRICAEEGCPAPSEEMRALVDATLTSQVVEGGTDEGPDDEVCANCGAPEDERGYRPAGEVERG